VSVRVALAGKGTGSAAEGRAFRGFLRGARYCKGEGSPVVRGSSPGIGTAKKLETRPMEQFSIKPVTTTRRTKSGSAIAAIIVLPDGYAAEQLPSEVAKELTGEAKAFAIVNRNSKVAPKGDLTAAALTPDAIAAIVAQVLAAQKAK